MPEMIFPPTPADGDAVTQPNGKTYKYNGAKARWETLPPATTVPGMVFIETVSVTNAARMGVALDSVTYASFYVEVVEFITATLSTELILRTGSDGANPDSGAADYSWVYNLTIVGADPADARGDNIDSNIRMGHAVNQVGDSDLVSLIDIIDPGAPGKYTQIQHHTTYTASNFIDVVGSGRRASNTPVNYFQLQPFSGNITAGTMHIYGIRGA